AVGAACARGRRHLAIAHGSDVRLLPRRAGSAAVGRGEAPGRGPGSVARRPRAPRPRGGVLALATRPAPPPAPPHGAARRPGPAPERARQAVGVDGFVVALLGRLMFDKGCDLLVEALPEGATLLVAGAGPERAALERQATGRRVRFLGHLAGADKLALLAAAD